MIYLHIFVLDVLAGGNTVRDVEVHELWRKLSRSRQAVDHLHRVKTHVHIYKCREVVIRLRVPSGHETKEALNRNHWVVLH